MDLPEAVREQFRRHGREGGRARARALPSRTRAAISRRAAIRRWIRRRFGVARFADLRLPGADLIDQGLDDLAADRVTVESLLVSLAAPRLRREGLPLPSLHLRDAHRRLYRRLEKAHGALAHARHLALLERVVSFADACSRVRVR